MKTVSEEIYDALVEEIRKEIDKEILEEIQGRQLASKGWEWVDISDSHLKHEFKPWLAENTTNEYLLGAKFICFKNPKDATLFLMRWS